MLLCYAKASGQAGRVKRLSPEIASRLWFVGEEDVRQMEMAATNDGALVVDEGDWVRPNWAHYQDDDGAKERMRRYRDRLKTDDSVTDVTRNGRNVTGVTTEEKRREEKRRDIFPPTPPSVGRPEEREWFDYGNEIELPNLEIEKAWDYYTANGWKVGKAKNPVKDWRAVLRNWKRTWEK
jgi:hypothetical protein